MPDVEPPVLVAGYLAYDEDREEWVIDMGDWEPDEAIVSRRDDGVWVEVTIRRYGFQP